MKICIYGAGAIGGYLGFGLAKVPGVKLSLVARGENLKVMQTEGLGFIKDGALETVSVIATDNPAELGPQDYVIVALKSHQAWETAEQIMPLLGSHTAVLTCQNGVPWWYFHGLKGDHAAVALESVDPGARQWRSIGPERAIGCVVYPAAELAAPGIVKHVYGNKFALGEPDGTCSVRAESLSRVLIAAGFDAPVLDDIRSEIWLKLWGNLCFNPISALTGATLDIVATDPDTRGLADTMMQEAEIIAGKLGSSFRVSRERRINGAAKVGAHKTSMLQDLERGRAMEIDALVTAVQEMGRLTETPTPMIDTVLGLARQLARSRGLYPADGWAMPAAQLASAMVAAE